MVPIEGHGLARARLSSGVLGGWRRRRLTGQLKEAAHSLGKAQSVEVAVELDDVATSAATVAEEDLALGGDEEGRSAVFVIGQRAAAAELASASLEPSLAAQHSSDGHLVSDPLQSGLVEVLSHDAARGPIDGASPDRAPSIGCGQPRPFVAKIQWGVAAASGVLGVTRPSAAAPC